MMIPSLERIIGKENVESYFSAYRDRKPLTIKGEKDRFTDLFEKGDFERALAIAWAYPDLEIRTKAGFFDSKGEHREIAISRGSVEDFLALDGTLCIHKIHRSHRKLEELSNRLKLELHYPTILINSYYSPDGKGFGIHFDDHDVLILQIHGKKKWKFSKKPVKNFPAETFVYSSKDADPKYSPPVEDSAFDHFELTPGDALYLPAGTWHQAKAEGESLALTIAFSTLEPIKLMTDLIKNRLMLSETIRVPFPPIHPRDVKNGSVPEIIEDLLSENLKALQNEIAQLQPKDFFVAWRRSVGNAEKAPHPFGELSKTDFSNQNGNSQRKISRIVINRDLQPMFIPHKDTTLLFIGHLEIKLTEATLQIVTTLLKKETWSIDDFIEKLDFDLERDQLISFFLGLEASGLLELT